MALSREDFVLAMDAMSSTSVANDMWPLLYDFLLTYGFEDVAASMSRLHALSGVYDTAKLTVAQRATLSMPHINVQIGRPKSTRR